MGLLEDAIREHLDLKRSRGADPSEIERLEREALGPVRREPVSGGDRFEPVGGGAGHSPVEYHDSTAPHWQQDEDFGEHHVDRAESEVHDPEPGKRRGFLRRSRGGSTPEPEALPEPEVGLGWPDYDEPATGFADEHFGAPHAVPEGHFDELAYDDLRYVAVDPAEDLSTRYGVEEPASSEQSPMEDRPDEHPQAGGRFEPDYGPPTEVYTPADVYTPPSEVYTPPVDYAPVEAPAAEVPALTEVEQIVTPPPAPQAAAHHPILDDLPGHEPEVDIHGFGQVAEESIDLTPPTPAAREPVPEPPAAASEVTAAPAHDDEPPQLQFANPPKRPTFSPEPPGTDNSDVDPPKRPKSSRAGRTDELQGTLEFDVASQLDDAEAEEDVLEVTPDFLQDTPEHDRLWFEQRPPKDFDFDG